MPDRYFLRQEAFCCKVDESLVFLHAGRCEYLAFSANNLAELSRQIAGATVLIPTTPAEAGCVQPANHHLLVDLVRRGILTTSSNNGKPLDSIALTSRRALPASSSRETPSNPTSAPSIRLPEVLRFFVALARVTRRLRQRDLLRLLRRIDAAKAGLRGTATQTGVSDLGVLTGKFDRLRVWSYSAEGACLKDSLVLAHFLLSCGVLPTFVIGVRSKPFAAHAWVQSGDIVLNDSVEHIQQYTPILAI